MNHITLVKRENIDCSAITVDEFIKMLYSDLIEAEEKYNDIYSDEYVNNCVTSFNRYVESFRKKAIKFAEKKWKTEKKRMAYVNMEVEKARNSWKSPYYYGLSFFDIDAFPGEMIKSYDSCISYDNLTFAKLVKCFNCIKENKFFVRAKGWVLEYETSENSVKVSSRPYIKLILDNDVENEFNEMNRKLERAISEFYKNTTYFGD